MKKVIKIKINVKDLVKVTAAAAIGYISGKVVEAGIDNFCEVKRLADKYLSENGIGETVGPDTLTTATTPDTATVECHNDTRDEMDNLPCKKEN